MSNSRKHGHWKHFYSREIRTLINFQSWISINRLSNNGPRELGVGCESLCHTHVFAPKLIQILNSNPSKRNKWTSFYRSRSLLVASLSGCVHAGCSLWMAVPWNCKHSYPVHTTPEKFEKSVNHSENTSNVFRPHFVGEIWKRNNHQSFWICVWVDRDVIVLEKLYFNNVFRSNLNTKPAFSNSSGLNSVFVWRAPVFVANYCGRKT